MKIKNCFIGFSIMVVFASPTFPQDMNVSGAGTEEVNGIYVVAGKENGADYYKKGTIFLYRNQGKSWHLSTTLGSIDYAEMYYEYNLAGPPTPDGLTFNNTLDLGIDPKPSVNESSLPIELFLFNAKVVPQGVQLFWITESELDNLGFIVERRIKEAPDWITIASFQTNTELTGQGTTGQRTEYQFLDQHVHQGFIYQYRLSDVSVNGKRTSYHPIDVLIGNITGTKRPSIETLPDKFEMLPAFPNPFNPQTAFRYHIPNACQVSLKVFDIAGRMVAWLVEGSFSAGEYQINWNAVESPGGTYLIVLQAGAERQVQKVVLLK